MRIIELHNKQGEVTFSADGKITSLDTMLPMDIFALAIAKDILNEVQKKCQFLDIELGEFSIRVVLRKNMEKAKSKIIETHLKLPDHLAETVKDTLQKIADRSHLKRLLSNEILFEPTQLKD